MAERIGIAVDPETNDFTLADDGTLAVVTDAQAVGQHVRSRLKHFWSEWFLDTEAGVRWLDEIMGRPYDPVLAEAIVKDEIFNTDGVTDITSFSVSFTRRQRELRIRQVVVETIFDEQVSV